MKINFCTLSITGNTAALVDLFKEQLLKLHAYEFVDTDINVYMH